MSYSALAAKAAAGDLDDDDTPKTSVSSASSASLNSKERRKQRRAEAKKQAQKIDENVIGFVQVVVPVQPAAAPVKASRKFPTSTKIQNISLIVYKQKEIEEKTDDGEVKKVLVELARCSFSLLEVLYLLRERLDEKTGFDKAANKRNKWQETFAAKSPYLQQFVVVLIAIYENGDEEIEVIFQRHWTLPYKIEGETKTPYWPRQLGQIVKKDRVSFDTLLRLICGQVREVLKQTQNESFLDLVNEVMGELDDNGFEPLYKEYKEAETAAYDAQEKFNESQGRYKTSGHGAQRRK